MPDTRCDTLCYENRLCDHDCQKKRGLKCWPDIDMNIWNCYSRGSQTLNLILFCKRGLRYVTLKATRGKTDWISSSLWIGLYHKKLSAVGPYSATVTHLLILPSPSSSKWVILQSNQGDVTLTGDPIENVIYSNPVDWIKGEEIKLLMTDHRTSDPPILLSNTYNC